MKNSALQSKESFTPGPPTARLLLDPLTEENHQVIALGNPVRSKWYRSKPVICRSPSEGIIRNAVFHLVKEARFSLKRALGTGSQVSIGHAKDKVEIAAFMVRNYKHAYSKRPL